jgi:hypothetical protein
MTGRKSPGFLTSLLRERFKRDGETCPERTNKRIKQYDEVTARYRDKPERKAEQVVRMVSESHKTRSKLSTGLW